MASTSRCSPRRASWGAMVAVVLAHGAATAQPVTDGFKAEAIEALNAAATAAPPAQPVQPAPAAAPVADAPRPAPAGTPASSPGAAPAAPATPIAPAAGRAPAGVSPASVSPASASGDAPAERLSDTLPLKREPEGELTVGQDASPGVSLTGLAFASLLLGAAALLAWWLQKRTNARKGAGGLDTTVEVLSSTRIAGRFQISLVRVPGAILVVGVSDKGLTLLTELPPDALGPAPAPGVLPQLAQMPSQVSSQMSSQMASQTTGAPVSTATAQARYRATQETEGVRATARRPEPAATPAARDTNEFLEQLLRAEQAQAQASSDPGATVEGEQLDIRRRLQRYQKGGMGME